MVTGEVWSISDGVTTVNFTPGAKIERVLDKNEGLKILPRANTTVPKYKDFKRAHHTFVVTSNFKDRESDIDALFTMIETQPVASNYTFSRDGTTFTVVVHRLRELQDSGDGTIHMIICEMEKVTT